MRINEPSDQPPGHTHQHGGPQMPGSTGASPDAPELSSEAPPSYDSVPPMNNTQGVDSDLYGPDGADPISGAPESSAHLPPDSTNGEHASEVPESTPGLDILDRIPNLFRLLDLVEDRSSGGIVEKIVIDQQSFSKFINTIQPGSYTSISIIDFNALDDLSIKPVGMYGTQSEIFEYLKGTGCLDHACETIIFKPDHQGNPVSVLRSGLYITMNHKSQPIGSSKSAYLLYWPESETWDDQQSAETVSNTLRRNRETFMRFLTKLCDQTIALVSSSQAEAFVWESTAQSNVPGSQRGNDARSRMEEFHVLELDEQDDDVVASPGFEISVEQLMRRTPNTGSSASDMCLVEGEERIGLLMRKTEEGQFKDKSFDDKVSKTVLRQMIQSGNPYHLILGSVSPDSLKILAANGLQERYPGIFGTYANSQADARNTRQTLEAKRKENIENMITQDRLWLSEEIQDMVCKEYGKLMIGPGEVPLHHVYEPGLGRVRKDIQRRKINQIENSEFQALKMRWIPLHNRLEQNPQASERHRVGWVDEVINGIPGSSDEESWYSRFWNNVTDRLGGSANLKKLSDPEFIAQIQQSERQYPCLSPLTRIILDILHKDMEELTSILISTHLDTMVSSEQQSRIKALEEECDHTFGEVEIKLFGSLIQSLREAMTSSLPATSILYVNSIRQEYQYTGHRYRHPTAWLLWKGSKRDYVPPQTRYHIYPFEFTTQDRHQSELDEGHIPIPRAAQREWFNFAIPINKSIEFIRFVQNKCLLAISDATEGYLRFYAADNFSMASELQTEGLVTLRHERLGGSQYVYAFDQTTRFLAIIHGCEDPQLSLLRFDQRFTKLQRYRAPISLSAWYRHRPEISAACFQAGRPELFLIESSGSVQLVSISAEMIRPAPFQIAQPLVSVFSSPDGSWLLAAVGGAAPLEPQRLLAFHWDTSGLADELEGITATELPQTETPCVATRFYGKGRIHVVSLVTAANLVKSTMLQIKQRTTEFAFRSENDALPTGGIQTANNSLIDCHLEIWTRFPVVPTITRITPVPISRKPRQLVFVSPISLPQANAYFERMISTLRRTTHKPVDRELTTTMVSSAKSAGCELFESASEFKLGSFIVELICLIPIHIAATMDNKFMPLKDGVWDPDYESSLAGLTIAEINESLSFGWYESIFQSYMADKMVRVVSSMGEQSVGKSYCLNHFADTSFAGSAMRTTEGAWLSCTPTKDYLLVSLDFEGLQSTERSPQEDMLLVLFNTAISNLILFRNNFAVSRNVRGLFTTGKWDSIEREFNTVITPKLKMTHNLPESLASSRAHQLKKRLKMALSRGTTPDGPLKNMNTDKEIVTLEDEPIFFVPDDQGGESTDTQDHSNASHAEYKKKQGETMEETLKILVQRCGPSSISRQHGPGPDSTYFETLQKSLNDILDRRFDLVDLWINVNIDGLPADNVELRELARIFDSIKANMRAAVQLCQSSCTSCKLHCMHVQSHSESGEHDCSTDHRCQSHCEVREGHSELPLCGLKAGHVGKHTYGSISTLNMM
ncbi:hypothetical protein FRC11_009539 [Ceratobasidium sp. 423]|nr:hypothetical protein FRC11_009539 [Ceratobasidium sp. 423]